MISLSIYKQLREISYIQWQSPVPNNQYNTLPILYPSIINSAYILIASYLSSDTKAITYIEVYKDNNCRYYISSSYTEKANSSNIISIGY